jgi:enediyne biosynthesis protein E3
MTSVSCKMDSIQNIFRSVQSSSSETKSLPELFQYLDSFEPEFRSIAYEAASMAIALGDLKDSEHLSSWFQFLEQANHHATQIHVGLGWALSQLQADPLPFIATLHPMMRYRVADGYGYYEGIFRKRKSVLSQQKPEWTDATASRAFDQGLGRSIWYLNQGQHETAIKMLESFPAERQADLFRGLGIAITYAGGCSEEKLLQISARAGLYKTQLATGAVMGLISRERAGYITEDAALACRVWCYKTVEELVSLYTPEVLSSESTESNAYSNWIHSIEAAF